VKDLLAAVLRLEGHGVKCSRYRRRGHENQPTPIRQTKQILIFSDEPALEIIGLFAM
jgi:hypothetical protein